MVPVKGLLLTYFGRFPDCPRLGERLQIQDELNLGGDMGGFRTWRRSVITELQRTKTKTKPGDQVGMEWFSTKTKFEMDDMEDLVGMIEDATTKGVGALENEIGSENVHHPTEIMGEGRGQIEVTS